jgi:hypothetical protein
MRFILTAAALLVPMAAHAERFAVHCRGEATFTFTMNGRTSPPRPPEPTQQIYVIDEEARTVHRALMPRQEFEDMCGTQGRCFRTFSPGLILIDQDIDGPVTMRSRLRLDRQSGRADFEMDVSDAQTRTASRWRMECERGEIPVFDPRRNRF